MLGPIVEGLFIGMIEGNTRATANAAMLPEAVKEATWIAKQFCDDTRRKSRQTRFWFGCLMTTATIIAATNEAYFWAAAWLIAWFVITVHFRNSAWNKAAAKAMQIMAQRKAKEDAIRDVMFQAAQLRLKNR